MTVVDYITFSVLLIVLGFAFGVTGVLITNNYGTQERFINFGGFWVGFGSIILVLSVICYVISLF